MNPKVTLSIAVILELLAIAAKDIPWLMFTLAFTAGFVGAMAVVKMAEEKYGRN